MTGRVKLEEHIDRTILFQWGAGAITNVITGRTFRWYCPGCHEGSPVPIPDRWHAYADAEEHARDCDSLKLARLHYLIEAARERLNDILLASERSDDPAWDAPWDAGYENGVTEGICELDQIRRATR